MFKPLQWRQKSPAFFDVALRTIHSDHILIADYYSMVITWRTINITTLGVVGADEHSAVPTRQTRARAKQLRFDRYVLDLDRGCLLLDGSEIVLRQKTSPSCRHLVENSGRLVAKDELFAAVWPNIAITDDVLVQSVGELRRALGEDGTRLIRTVPRRGYRFESEVSFAAINRSNLRRRLAFKCVSAPETTDSRRHA